MLASFFGKPAPSTSAIHPTTQHVKTTTDSDTTPDVISPSTSKLGKLSITEGDSDVEMSVIKPFNGVEPGELPIVFSG
jgi:hypothetical protein